MKEGQFSIENRLVFKKLDYLVYFNEYFFYISPKTLILFLQSVFQLFVPLRPVFDLETIPILLPHYHTHSGKTSRPVNLAVLRWLVSYEDENEYGNDNGNEIED